MRKSTLSLIQNSRLLRMRALYAWLFLLMPLMIVHSALADTDRPHCRYVSLATLPIEIVNNGVVVQGSINGKAAPMLIDTGATLTTLTSQGVEYFGLTLLHSPVSQFGIGGESISYQVIADDMALGKFHTRPHKRLIVAMDAMSPYKVIVGTNILFNADMEFNLGDHYVKFFEPSDCEANSLAYWDQNANQVALADMSSDDLRQVVTVEINGQKLRALVDSGAQNSFINTAFVARLGITPDSSNVQKIGASAGIGAHQIDTWLVKFDSFSIGDETIKNPVIRMMNLWGAAKSDQHSIAASNLMDDQPDMLLGADFLRTHRVLLALSQHRLYFSYTGGLVFPGVMQTSAQGSREQSGK